MSVNESEWALGRCPVPNDNKPGRCKISDGVGSPAGFRARIVVTYTPCRAFLNPYTWDGTCTFTPIWEDKQDSRNGNAVQIPLCVAAIERVEIRRGTESDQATLDATRSGEAGDFYVGMKSARRNGR